MDAAFAWTEIRNLVDREIRDLFRAGVCWAAWLRRMSNPLLRNGSVV
jgi:hypothetical protein